MVNTSIQINASAEKIWKALTTKEQMKEWYFDIPDFKLEEKSVFNFFETGETKEYHHQCEILEIIEHEKFVHTWTHPSHSKGTSTLSWILENNEKGVLIHLKHEGIEQFEDAGPAFSEANFEMGWKNILMMLKLYVNGIRRHTYAIEIDVDASTVWTQLFSKAGYESWTSIFTSGSHYKGNLVAGSRVHLLDANGGGMYSDVIFSIPGKLLIFQHIGEMKSFEEKELDAETENWSGSFETYRLLENEGKTKLTVEVDLAPEYVQFINEKFPIALNRLKENCEANI